MQSKSVIFYGITSDFLNVALKLIEKLYENKEKTLFLCDNEEEVKFIDSKLWTYSKLSFIPHGSNYTIAKDRAKFCHTWVSMDIDLINDPVCLIHNGLQILDEKINSFSKIIDIFNIDLINGAQERSKFYKDCGFMDQKFWKQVGTSWKSEELI